jgi:hypothetical protein
MASANFADGDSARLKVVRWVARVWAVILFLFWMLFFVEHLGGFAQPGEKTPARVWWLMALHLALLVGLAIGWRWELLGAGLVLVAGPLFFFLTAGKNALVFTVITSIPAVLWLICGLLAKRGVTAKPPF